MLFLQVVMTEVVVLEVIVYMFSGDLILIQIPHPNGYFNPEIILPGILVTSLTSRRK